MCFTQMTCDQFGRLREVTGSVTDLFSQEADDFLGLKAAHFIPALRLPTDIDNIPKVGPLPPAAPAAAPAAAAPAPAAAPRVKRPEGSELPGGNYETSYFRSSHSMEGVTPGDWMILLKVMWHEGSGEEAPSRSI